MANTYEIVITPKAEENIEAILDYLILNESYDLAEKIRTALLEEIESLSKMPTAQCDSSRNQ